MKGPGNVVDLVVLGAGTAGYWFTSTIASSPLAGRIAGLAICDRGVIGRASGITCPDYSGDERLGRPKCDRLAELAPHWFSPHTLRIETYHGAVEDLQWRRLFTPRERASGDRGRSLLVGVIALDRWSSRLAAVEDARSMAEASGDDVLLLQIGLDRGQASLAAFGSTWTDPCPACGLAFLPETESCVAYTTDHELVRGNLHAEAQAAARLAVEIIEDGLRGGRSWVNTKTFMFERPDEIDYRRLACAARRFPECCGPHASATALRWEDLLEPLEEEIHRYAS